MSRVGSFYPGYDANGNLTNDGVHSYAWDADGNSITIDSIGLTFDALGRMVEQNRSGVYTQIVYGPTGGKLALMSGQTLSKGFVPLSGGATAVYNSGGLAYYRHSDWLGSSRLASTPSRTVYYDGAYAPYGENYAETGTTDRAFTGQNQDTISSGAYPLYDFLYREDHPVWGRWLSPDPLAGDITNPQSLNRYAYVLNNPANLFDPLGLDPPQGPPPHPGCGQDPTIACVWEKYGWTIPGMFGAGLTCYVDNVKTPCDMTFGLLQSGAAIACPNNDCTGVRAEQGPGGTTIITRTQTITIQVPGGCVTIGSESQPCNAPSSYQAFTITTRQTVNDVLLSPDAVYVLGRAGKLAEGPANLAAVGTGAVMAVPVLISVGLSAWPYALVYAGIVEAAYPGCIGEFLSGLAPAPSGASTPCYALGLGAGGAYDWLKKH